MDQPQLSMYPELTLELLKQAAKAFAAELKDMPLDEIGRKRSTMEDMKGPY